MAQRLARLADGEGLEVITKARDDVDSDLRALCRATGQELARADIHLFRPTAGSRQAISCHDAN